MASPHGSHPAQTGSNSSRAKTPEERENELVRAAVDLAEQQIRSGTASAQVITHYLKLGSSREKLEQERIRHENRMMVTKTELMQAQKESENLAQNALRAFRAYAGHGTEEEAPDLDEFND